MVNIWNNEFIFLFDILYMYGLKYYIVFWKYFMNNFYILVKNKKEIFLFYKGYECIKIESLESRGEFRKCLVYRKNDF